MAVKTYSFADVDFIWGPNKIDGFADGDSITIEADEDLWTKQTGNDGATTRSQTVNYGAKVTARLQQTSLSNAVFQASVIADRVSRAGVEPLLIKDRSSQATLYSAETAWIAKQPQATFAGESKEREWVIDTDNLLFNEAGNV